MAEKVDEVLHAISSAKDGAAANAVATSLGMTEKQVGPYLAQLKRGDRAHKVGGLWLAGKAPGRKKRGRRKKKEAPVKVPATASTAAALSALGFDPVAGVDKMTLVDSGGHPEEYEVKAYRKGSRIFVLIIATMILLVLVALPAIASAAH